MEQSSDETRRAWASRVLGSLLCGGLLQLSRLAEASSLSSRHAAWWAELSRVSARLRRDSSLQLHWQTEVTRLCRSVEFEALQTAIRFEALQQRFVAQRWNELGPFVQEAADPLLQMGRPFRLRLFSLPRGRSIVPHGHNNIASAFLVLHGSCRGRHYERVSDATEYLLLRPSSDHTYAVGTVSTISDERDNVHWFTAGNTGAQLLNVMVRVGPHGRHHGLRPSRIYLDPTVASRSDGLIEARRMNVLEATRRFG